MGIIKNHIGLPCILLFLLFSADLRAQSAMKKSEEKLADLFGKLRQITYPNTQDVYANTQDINASIEAEFISILTQPGSMSYTFPAITNDITSTLSDDGRLRFISWYSKLGGTMEYIKVVSQYMGPDKKLYAQNIKNENSIYFDQAVDFYQIHQIGPNFYLAMGHGKYDTHERAYSVYNFKIENNILSDTAQIFYVDSEWNNNIRNHYSAFLDTPISAEIMYDEGSKEICYTRYEEDQSKGVYINSEDICLTFDGRNFRRKK